MICYMEETIQICQGKICGNRIKRSAIPVLTLLLIIQISQFSRWIDEARISGDLTED